MTTSYKHTTRRKLTSSLRLDLLLGLTAIKLKIQNKVPKKLKVSQVEANEICESLSLFLRRALNSLSSIKQQKSLVNTLPVFSRVIIFNYNLRFVLFRIANLNT